MKTEVEDESRLDAATVVDEARSMRIRAHVLIQISLL